MSVLREEPLRMLCATLNGENSLPSYEKALPNIHFLGENLGDDDELFLNYRAPQCNFPYRSQDAYTRELEERTLQTFVLENDYLRATFLPSYGGRLLSLFDKRAGRELLFKNPVLRMGNLAVRNAWFSGGVEWNCGICGHTPYTCSPLHVATLQNDEGEPVLRMYEYERIRAITYQMDFSLPDASPFLQCRMRVVNPSRDANAVYWWSNIAVADIPDLRIIVPADSAYTNKDGRVFRFDFPNRDGLDKSYPNNTAYSMDYFYRVPDQSRKYIAAVGKDGYGLMQCSTSRLKGRKLFVWGTGEGAKHWQEFLSGDGSDGRYCEIQAGLGRTQYENLPIPPCTAWEWTEFYGAVQLDPQATSGEYKGAQQAAERWLGQYAPLSQMEELLKRTKALALTPAQTLLQHGSGWAALEQERRLAAGESPLSPHLDFGKTDRAQAQWLSLLRDGTLGEHDPCEIPPSWMLQEEWTQMLEKAVQGKDAKNWYTHLQLGCVYLAQNRMEEGRSAVAYSLSLVQSAWAHCVLSYCYELNGDSEQVVKEALLAQKLLPNDPFVAVFFAKKIFRLNAFNELYDYILSLPPQIAELPRIRLYRAFAAVETGRISEAESLMLEGDGLIVPDMQECERTLGDLWLSVEQKKAAAEGRPAQTTVPHRFNFSMMGD